MKKIISEWNYRVVVEDGYYAIREVYYEKNKPIAWSEGLSWPQGANFKELQYDVFLMTAALLKPILKVGKGDKLIEMK